MKKQTVIYGIYEDDEYEECRFIGTCKEVSEELKMSEGSLRCAINRKSKIQGNTHKRYLIYRLYKEAKDEQIRNTNEIT